MQKTYIVSHIQQTIKRDNLVVIVNDFDGTIALYGASEGDNPFDAQIHPLVAKALQLLQSNKNVVLSTISNRSAAKIADLYAQNNLFSPLVMGTYGLEAYATYKSVHMSYMASQFAPVREAITNILLNVRQAVYSLAKLEEHVCRAEITIPFQNGVIYLEAKGIAPKYPEGIAHVYNLNQIDPPKRSTILRVLQSSYEDARKRFVTQQNSLGMLWGLTHSQEDPLSAHRYSWALEPLSRENKQYGINTLVETLEDTYKKPVGLILYAGDNYEDTEAIRAAKLIMQKNKNRVVIGIKIGHEKLLDAHLYDMQVETVEEYAHLLENIGESLAAKEK